MPKAVFVSKIGSRTLSGVGMAALVVGLGHATPSACAPAGEKVPYMPSRFPGVQVRQVPVAPAPMAATGGAAWLGKRPGTVAPRGVPSTVRGARPATPLRTGRGTTAAGGKWVAMPPERVPLAVARDGRSGKPAIDCHVPHALPTAPTRSKPTQFKQAPSKLAQSKNQGR